MLNNDEYKPRRTKHNGQEPTKRKVAYDKISLLTARLAIMSIMPRAPFASFQCMFAVLNLLVCIFSLVDSIIIITLHYKISYSSCTVQCSGCPVTLSRQKKFFKTRFVTERSSQNICSFYRVKKRMISQPTVG